MTKDEIRASMKLQRKGLSKEYIKSASDLISKRILTLDELKNAETIMVFLSSFNEPRTDLIISELLAQKKKIVVPVSDTITHTITPSYLDTLYDTSSGAYNIREPKELRIAQTTDIDIALIPALALSRYGNRIGFGMGYYDRFLSDFNGLKIGVCYDFQIFDTLPHNPHDVKMDLIITEKRIYNDF